MLYIAIFAISLLTASNAACQSNTVTCNSNTCQGGCYRDADDGSSTYGCDICQDYDPCGNYPNYCETDADCSQYASTTGIAMECSEISWANSIGGAPTGSNIVCPYCKEVTTTNTCYTDSDCGDIMYRCYKADPTRNVGECLIKCPYEDCGADASGSTVNACTVSTATGNVRYGTCNTDMTSEYYCRKCEVDVTTAVPDTTAADPTTTDPATTDTVCDVSYGYISMTGSVSGGYCGLTLEDCTVIREDAIVDTYKEQMIQACPDLADCWDDRVHLNSCGCPRCTTVYTTEDPCANVNGYPCDTTDECIDLKGDTWGCAYTSSDGCMTCQQQCDGQCIDDTDCRTYTQTGGATYTRQGSCVRDGGSNYGCKTCVYEETTTKPTTTGGACECTPGAYDDSCKSWQYCDGTTASGASSNTCGVCVDYCPDLSLNPAGIPSSCYIEAGNDQCNNNALNIMYYCVDDGNDDLCGICSTSTTTTGPIVCTADAKECPDGSFVGRDPDNDCEFFPCDTTTTTSGTECCSYREYISFFDSNGFPGADGGYGCCPGGYWVTLNDAIDPNDANSGKMDCNGEYYEPRTGDNYFCPCECYISMTSSGLAVGTGCDADEECMPFDDDWKWSNVAADNYRRCGYCDGGIDGSSTEEPVFCTDDARQCPDGSYVSRDPDNDCEFEPCPCCLKEDLEAVKENAIGIPFGGYTCCPDGTIGQGNDVITDINIGMTMFCDNYDEQLPIRPINNYLCSNTTTEEPIFCTQDAKKCPDGSVVGRDPDNDCEFFPCPTTTTQRGCTDDAKICPDGSVVSRDPYNNCEFEPCPCCSQDDYDAKLSALRNDVSGSNVYADLGCCPDGTVVAIYGNSGSSDRTMACDGVSYVARPQYDYTCSNATTTTEAGCCKVDDDGTIYGCLSGQTCVDFYDGCGYCDGGSSGNMIQFMVAIGFTLGLFAWMH